MTEILTNIWDIIVMIGIQDLATTILKQIGQILRYTSEVIFDLLASVARFLEFLSSFQVVEDLFRLIGDVLERLFRLSGNVLEFAFTNTVWKPMKYYYDYIAKPTSTVRTFDHYFVFSKNIIHTAWSVKFTLNPIRNKLRITCLNEILSKEGQKPGHLV